MSRLFNEASIPQLLKEMTYREKIDLLVGKTGFTTLEMPQYGIPSLRYMDGVNGVNILQYVGDLSGSLNPPTAEEKDESSAESGAASMDWIGYVAGTKPMPDSLPKSVRERLLTLKDMLDSYRPQGEEPGCFPAGVLLGAAWDPQIVYRVGEAVGREAQAYGIDVLLGTPNVNIIRDPRGGRSFESFSEDPYLMAQLAPAMVKGVQDQGTIADVKHFAVNNQETLRQGINEIVSERAMREIYLPGFEAAVREGGVQTVMSAYNSINGVPCAHNHWLLTEVLRQEWGFEGQVVSDWGGAYDQVVALNAGNDLDMPGPRGKQRLYDAYEQGILPEERLNDAVTRMLKTILKSPAFCTKRYSVIDNPLSQKAAYDAAVGGITLLKNDGVLPLQKDTTVALFGKLTQRFMESGNGSAQVDTNKHTSLPQELARFTKNISLERLTAATQVSIITVGASGQEGSDRPHMRLNEEDHIMLRNKLAEAKVSGRKTVVLLNVAGPVELADVIDQIDALVMLYFPGMEGARAVADILFGAVSPSGKLPLTFPKTYRDTPTAINFPGEFGCVYYGEGIFVGYRYYDYKNIQPLYPFGFGLSYSSFQMTNLCISDEKWNYTSGAPLRVCVDVQNTGTVAASEVVQLYISHPEATLQKPDQELKGFAKVHLQPGETKTVCLQLEGRSFASYDVELKEWTVEPGNYQLRVGNSSRDIFCCASVKVMGPNPYGGSTRSTLAYFVAHPEAFTALTQELGALFNEEAFKSMCTYFGNTKLLAFLQKTLPKNCDQEQIIHRLNDRLQQLDM